MSNHDSQSPLLLRFACEMRAKDIDYSLYLVTDSTPAILGDKDLVSVVRHAIAGGRLSPFHLSPAAHSS